MAALGLAVPFLVGIAVLKGLTVEIDTFHGSDAALYQLPTIMQFRDGLDFSDYPSAQTPLFHLVMAGWGKVVGFELWKLRLLNAAISYGAALALLRLVRRATPLGPAQALALTLVFTLSPYFFGASFTLLTDNLALLFAFLALERIEAFRRSGTVASLALACLALSAAVLTRQSFVWLAAVAAWFVVRGSWPVARKLAGLALVALALSPLLGLVIAWDGLVPKGSDPGSCGLCGDQPGGEGLSVRPVALTVALLGAYAAVLFGPVVLRRARALPAPAVLAAVALGGVALLLVSPLSYEPKAPGRPGDGGWLWKVADRFPELAGSSLLYFVLVPAGLLALWLLVRRAGVESLPAVAFAAFLLAALPVRLVYQKYFDPMALVTLALLARPPDLRTRRDYAGVAVLCVAFVAYAISFSGD
jgi:hypothetical protein